jgi:probable HAF family extracellular repeat protein
MFPINPRRIYSIPGIAVVSLLLIAPNATARQVPTISQIIPLPGWQANVAMGVSGDGRYSTGYSTASFSNTLAYRRSDSGVMESLGTLGGPFDNSEGRAINSDGSVVVGFGSVNQQPGNDRAFRFTTNSGIQNISRGSLSRAYGVSGDGNVVTGYAAATSPNSSTAFRWTPQSGMQPLALLPGTRGGFGYAVSADGSTIVGNLGDAVTARGIAVRWNPDGSAQRIGLFPGVTEGESYARAVSANGAVVVGYSTAVNGSQQAFRWTAEEGMVAIGTVLSFQSQIVANAISADGSVVVGSCNYSNAFYWKNGLILDLNTYLPQLGLDLTGWELYQATGLSADGRTICGIGTYNGVWGSWVVSNVVPSPSVASMLAASGFAIARRSRRR